MGSFCGFSHQMFYLGKDLLDGVQVWRIERQEQQSGADAAEGPTYGGTLVAAQIIHEDHIAPRERRQQT